MTDTEATPPQHSREIFEARIDRLRRSPSGKFTDLARRVELRPETDLRFGDFSNCRFNRETLRGFDFTGCNLAGSTFLKAKIAGAKFDCAKLDPGALRQAADYWDYLRTELGREPSTRHRPNTSRLRDLAIFRETPFAPEMVVLPAGEFDMGSDLGDAELGRDDQAYEDEIVPGRGKRRMRIPHRFAMGRYPVTFEEYDVFTDATGRERVGDEKWGRERRPVINVSWEDARAYAAWLNERLGVGAYRLHSEAEWEYACRAGTNTRRWWGDSWDASHANGAMSFEGGRTSPVDRFGANPWKLHDMIGNVWEWCADKWADNIAKLPKDGAPFGDIRPLTASNRKGSPKSKRDSAHRALRGGSWSSIPWILRSAIRNRIEPDDRDYYIGFRLSRTL